jgi:predicted GNAT superfamily acetyltransferase
LQSSNAYFNFAKLGVTSNTYYQDYYGEMRDVLNKGLPSDRFLVEWWITSDDVVQRVNGTFQQPRLEKISHVDTVNTTKKRDDVRRITSFDLNLTSNKLLVEIPSDINTLKSENLKTAQEWRKATRDIFENYFSKGFTAYNVLSEVRDGERRTFYLLRRDAHENSAY